GAAVDVGVEGRGDRACVLVGGAVEDLAREKLLSLTGSVDQQDRMRAREQHAGRQLQGLRFRLDELGDAAVSGRVQPRLATNVLIELAVASLLLVEAVAQTVLGLPGHKARDDVGIGRLTITNPEPIALLDRPAVAGLTPVVLLRTRRIELATSGR